MNPPAPKPGPVIIPAVSRRETIIAFASGLTVLGLLAYGVLQMGDGQQKASSNTLTGKVIGRSFTPLKEEVIVRDAKIHSEGIARFGCDCR